MQLAVDLDRTKWWATKIEVAANGAFLVVRINKGIDANRVALCYPDVFMGYLNHMSKTSDFVSLV